MITLKMWRKSFGVYLILVLDGLMFLALKFSGRMALGLCSPGMKPLLYLGGEAGVAVSL